MTNEGLFRLVEEIRAFKLRQELGEIPMGQEFSFNPMAYELQKAMDPLPTGWYRCVAKKAELVQADYGMGLKMLWKVIDGPYKDREIKSHYNIRHTNAQTMQIAEREVATFQGCMNLWAGTVNTDQMLDIPLQIRFIPTTSDQGGYNEAKGYKTIDGNDPVKPGTGQAMQVASAPAAPLPPAAPAAPAAPATPAPFPPPGWTAHPTAPGFYYAGQECISEADLKARYPAAPPVPPAPPAAPAAPVYNPASAQYAPPQQPGAAPAAVGYAAGGPAAPPAPGQAAPPVWTPNTPGAPAPPVWKP